MAKRTPKTSADGGDELADGRAFMILEATKMPISMIAKVTNTPEAEVMRLINLAKSAGFEPKPDRRERAED